MKRLLALILSIIALMASCKARHDLSLLQQDSTKNLDSNTGQAINLLRQMSPIAYEAALLYRSITLDSKVLKVEMSSTQKEKSPGAYNPFGPNGYEPFKGKGYNPFGSEGVYTDIHNKGMPGDISLEHYKKGGSVAGKNAGLINHFHAIRELNDAGSSMSYSKARATFMNWLNAVDQKYPTKQSVTRRPEIGYVGPDLWQNALAIMSGNVFKAATVMADLGHDDFNGYNIHAGVASNLYAEGVLGEHIRVPEQVRGAFKESVQRLNQAIPKNHQDLGGAYNYQMLGGFYMGCQLAKLGIPKIQVNQRLVDSVLGVGLNQYYGNMGRDQCITDFLNQRVCKTEGATPATGLFASALSTLTKQYEFDLTTDFPALGGYYYKVITLEERLNTSRLNSLKYAQDTLPLVLFKKGYINPFMAERNEFKKPDDFSDEDYRRAILYLDARLTHIQYVMEQHRVGAVFGSKVCGDYKARLAQELSLSGLEAKIFDMGFMQPGIKLEHVKRRADFQMRLGAEGENDQTMEEAITRLNKILMNNLSKVDWIYPDAGIMERAITVPLEDFVPKTPPTHYDDNSDFGAAPA